MADKKSLREYTSLEVFANGQFAMIATNNTVFLFSSQAREIDRLQGQHYGFTKRTEWNQRCPNDPKFCHLKKIPKNILVVVGSHTYFHLVGVCKNRLAMLKEDLAPHFQAATISYWNVKTGEFMIGTCASHPSTFTLVKIAVK